MSETRMLRKLLVRFGSRGAWSVTAGLSSVGPPPTLMMIQLLASATYVGSPERMVLPPSTSVSKRQERSTSSETMKWVSAISYPGWLPSGILYLHGPSVPASAPTAPDDHGPKGT